MRLKDINLLGVGHTIQLYGAIYSGNGGLYLLPLPDEDPDPVRELLSWVDEDWLSVLEMDLQEWKQFLRQSDVLDIQGPGKAILRKSQRQIDQNISWAVYRRDDYSCRYCGRDNVPLTVDHIILWEENGATTEDNLLSCCRRCNKDRGNTQYQDWIVSRRYQELSKNLPDRVRNFNKVVLETLPQLRGMTVARQRSR